MRYERPNLKNTHHNLLVIMRKVTTRIRMTKLKREGPQDNDNIDSAQTQLTVPSQRALGKRRRIEVDEATASTDNDALPGTQQTASRRIQVRPERKDDGFNYY